MGSISLRISSHIRRHFLPYLLLSLLVILNITILVGLVDDWYHDDNYSHGFLIIPIAIYLLYKKRNEIVLPVKPSKLGLIVFVVACIGLIFGTAAKEFFTSRFSLVLAVTGVAIYYLGWVNFRKVWFPFFFLLFMIPLPATIYYSATLPMQIFATKVTHVILKVFGVPALRQGNIIYLPNYALEVAEACSGLRSLVTLLALAALIGYITLSGKIKPIILFVSAVPIAIALNIFRLVFTAVGAYAISTKLAEHFLHELSGIIVFFLALIIMLLFATLLRVKGDWKFKQGQE
jgi:exosortase